MDISNVAMTQFTSSALVVYAMQRLKSAKWFPYLQDGKAFLSRMVSIIAAAAISLGIAWSWTKDPATGTHTLVITGLSIWTFLHGVWHWLNQYALQETVYQVTANKVGVTTDAAGSIPTRVAPSGAMVIPETPKGV